MNCKLAVNTLTASPREPDRNCIRESFATGSNCERQTGATTARVRGDIGGGVIVTSSITDELGLATDQVVFAVIKASDVRIGVP